MKKSFALSRSIASVFIPLRTKIINPGFLKRKYAAYVINTQPKGFVVERRYNQFLEFRKELVRLNPGYIIAPIPKKKSGKKFEPEFLNKRRKQLQLFLNDALRHPLLRSDEILVQFLSLNSKDWENRAKLSQNCLVLMILLKSEL